MAIESYVVRIYRRNQQNPDQVAGTVMSPELEESHAFRTVTELLQLRYSSRVTEQLSTSSAVA